MSVVRKINSGKSYNGVLQSNKNEWIIATNINMHESCKYDVEENMQYDSAYVKLKNMLT